MGEHAFIGMIAQQSVPIRGITPLFNSAEYKKNLALQNSAELADRLRGNVINYNKRMADFAAKREEQYKAEVEAEMTKQWNAISSMNLGQTNDPYKLKYGLGLLSSASMYARYHKTTKSVEDIEYATKKLIPQTTERYTKLKQGLDADSGDNPNYMGAEFQQPGQKDIIS